MPTVLRMKGYRFFFYSNEGNEPPHIHVEKGDAAAKYWLIPVSEVYSFDFNQREKKELKTIILDNQVFLKEKWDEYFGKS